MPMIMLSFCPSYLASAQSRHSPLTSDQAQISILPRIGGGEDASGYGEIPRARRVPGYRNISAHSLADSGALEEIACHTIGMSNPSLVIPSRNEVCIGKTESGVGVYDAVERSTAVVPSSPVGQWTSKVRCATRVRGRERREEGC